MRKISLKNFFAVFRTYLCSRKYALLAFHCCALSIAGFSQNVGISSTGVPPAGSAGLDINFSDKGLLVPRVSLTDTADITTIASPENSLLVYNTNPVMIGGGTGFWFWNGTAWTKLGNGSAAATTWSLLGNSGTGYGINFIGTTDNEGLTLRTSNVEALHIDSLQNVSIGVPATTSKLEVLGSFRLHQDSFNLLHTADLFFQSIPDVHFTGSTYKVATESGLYINGIMDLPGGISDRSRFSVVGNMDPDNAGIQSLLTAAPGNITLASQGINGASNINMDSAGNMNISVSTSDSSSTVNLTTADMLFYHDASNSGNSALMLTDSGITQKVYEHVTDYRRSSTNMVPDGYGIYADNDDPAENTHGKLELTSKGYLYNASNGNYDVQATQVLDTGKFSIDLANNSNGVSSTFTVTNSSGWLAGNSAVTFGIGTSSPTNTLHVAGVDPVRIEGLQSGSPVDNILTVDNTGVLHYSAAGASGWGLSGNAGTTPAANFLGTTDNQDLQFQVNSTQAGRLAADGQTFMGLNAGISNAGTNNTGIGGNALFSNTIGNNNTAVGTGALSANIDGLNNSSLGTNSLSSNTTGSYNTASGFNALNSNTTGNRNTGFGYGTLTANTTGSNNTAVGYNANVAANLTNATAIGYLSLANANNTLILGGTGANQVAVGIGTSAPVSYLETAGSFGTAIVTTTTTLTLTSAHYTVIVTGGTPSINLPAAATANNRRSYRIINQTGNPVPISSHIGFTGSAATTVPANSKIEVQSNGSNWYRVD